MNSYTDPWIKFAPKEVDDSPFDLKAALSDERLILVDGEGPGVGGVPRTFDPVIERCFSGVGGRDKFV